MPAPAPVPLPSDPNETRRQPRAPADIAIVVGVVLIATAVRALHLWQYWHRDPSAPGLYRPGFDMYVFHQWATEIATVHWQGVDRLPFWQSPLYPYFIGVMYVLFGVHTLPVFLAQILLGIAACAGAWWCGNKLAGRAAGASAGLLLAVCGPLIHYDTLLLRASMMTGLTLAMIAAWLAWDAHPTPRRGVFTGLLLAVLALYRTNALLLAPALALWPWRPRTGLTWRARLTASAALTAGTLAGIAPVTALNYHASGRFVLIADQGSINWYIGNAYDATGTLSYLPSLREIGNSRPWLDLIYDPTIPWTRLWWEGVRSHPDAALRVPFRKLRLFFGATEVPNNTNFYLAQEFAPVLRMPWTWDMRLFGPLALCGIVVTLRRRAWWPVHTYAAVYALSILLFYVTARFRAPLYSVMALYAGATTAWLWTCARERRWRRAVIAVIGMIAAAGVWGRTGVRYVRGADWYNLGASYVERDQLPQAEQAYRQAMATEPALLEARIALAHVLMQQEKAGQVAEILPDLPYTAPRGVAIALIRAAALEAQQRPEAAARTYLAILTAVPDSAEAAAGLARCRAALGLPAAAPPPL